MGDMHNHSIYVEVRRQLCGSDPFLPPLQGLQGLNSVVTDNLPSASPPRLALASG